SQPGVLPPFVFRADIPWGWLEYRSGNFMGQRLALKRQVVTLGRDEESDIWLDDELASRNHAELACDQEQRVYLTDLSSLNGTLLNGRPARGTVYVQSNDVIEIGSYCFLFTLAEHHTEQKEEKDPLEWRTNSSQGISSQGEHSSPLTPTAFPTTQQPFSGSGLLGGGPTPLRLPSKQKPEE
ncbi:MAG: FHA domain-containing protein, partial [Ktedonobacteraceae bacterium]|nr:FHA domain-containing protein [Ktedonobacteraceae bacterium]